MLAASLVAFVVAFQSTAETPTPATVHPYKIEAKYDRVRDYTLTGLDFDPVAEDRKGDQAARWSLVVSHVSKGEDRGPLDDAARTRFAFYRIGEDRTLDDFHAVAILADAFRSVPDEEYESERLGSGRIMETVSWVMPFGDFRKVAAASDVEIAIGSNDVRLTPRQVAALKDLSARLAIDSEAAEKLALEHFTLLRKRESDLHEAAGMAVEKAKAAVDKLPPARRKAEANRVGMRVFTEEFTETAIRYKPTDEETAQIIRDFPILTDATVELIRSREATPER